MKWRDLSERSRSTAVVASAAFIVVILSVLVVFNSVKGIGLGAFEFEEAAPGNLPPEADIAGWAWFERESYMGGEIGRCRIQSSVSFFPFDFKENIVSERKKSGGIREYVADYILQAVSVDSTKSYLLATATVYYTSSRIESGELQSLRINPPQLHVGELYPRDISNIPLRALKGKINDPTSLRQWLITLFGIALLVLATFLLWKSGRRRPDNKLSEAERLLREFHALRFDVSDKRQFLLVCERIFIRVLQLRTGLDATAFWSGRGTEDGAWQALTADARSLFSQSYRPSQPTDEDVERISALIRETLAPLVTEAEMRRELQPSFVLRLRQQPAVLATRISVMFFAAALFVLAVFPSSWVSSDVHGYNMAVGLIGDDETLERGYTKFSELARDAEDERVKAASFYNMGALVTDPRLTGQSPLQQRELLNAIFLPRITLDQLLHSLELDAEFELLTILADNARRYVQAETAMKAAVRVSPDDADIRRNLEILGKIRRALANTLAQLVDEGERSAGPSEMRRQTIIDLKRLMEIEMPEDFAKLEEGKDDTSYFIMERF
jgi:hypothetical protein